jgi:hypothetical protein
VYVTATPFNNTDVTLVNPVPVINTVFPTTPEVGAKVVMFGRTVKFVPPVEVPNEVVTLTGPVVAPEGTVATISLELLTVYDEITLLNRTAVTPLNPVPVIVMVEPIVPLVGVKLVNVGVTVKLLVVVAVPLPVVTTIFPVVAVLGTMAVSCVEEILVNVALTPLNVTLVAVRFVPVIVTVVPVAPRFGEKLDIVGGAVTVKSLELVAVPDGVVTAIFPVVAPDGERAEICVAELTVNVEVTPLNFTDVAPVNPVPLMTTDVPLAPLDGVKLVNCGVTLNVPVLTTFPDEATSVIFPVLPVVGTVALIEVAEIIENVVALTPLNNTSVTLLKFDPLMLTIVPTGPLVGANVESEGPAVTVKFDELVPVPEGLITLIFPDDAPVGTVAVIWVDETTVKLVAFVPLN